MPVPEAQMTVLFIASSRCDGACVARPLADFAVCKLKRFAQTFVQSLQGEPSNPFLPHVMNPETKILCRIVGKPHMR